MNIQEVSDAAGSDGPRPRRLDVDADSTIAPIQHDAMIAATQHDSMLHTTVQFGSAAAATIYVQDIPKQPSRLDSFMDEVDSMHADFDLFLASHIKAEN